jgi:uncharacterized protein
MGRITDWIARRNIIALDSSIFIYHLEEHPSYASFTHEILSGIEFGHWNGVTSVITLMEIGVKPISVGRDDIARKYEALLVNFPNLVICDIDRDVARKAALLRAQYRVRPPDALHLATAIVNRSQAFITNDRQLTRFNSLIPVLVLDDMIDKSK